MSTQTYQEAPAQEPLHTPEQDAITIAEQASKKSLKRNGFIFAGIVVAAVAIGGFMFWKAKQNTAAPVSTVGITTGSAGARVDDVAPRDKERLSRTSAEDASKALESDKSFIPKALPAEIAPPPAPNAGVGPGYDYRAGVNSASASTAAAQIPSDLKKAIEQQLSEIATSRSAPPTGRAEIYQVTKEDAPGSRVTGAAPANQQAPSTVAATSQAFAAKPLVQSLYITTGKLVSELDTAKTPFISMEVDSGPLAGAYLIGQASVTGDSGVRFSFRQMRFQGETYPINAIGMDVATSNDAMRADIDRKIFARYVVPILFSTSQAYLNARANPGQTVVLGGDGATIATPSATARQAAAAGVAAGIGKAAEAVAAANQGPNTAYLPVNSSLGLMFLDPVIPKEVKK